MEIKNESLSLQVDDKTKTITLLDRTTNQRLFIAPAEGWFCPVLNGKQSNAKISGIKQKDNTVVLEFQSEGISKFNVVFSIQKGFLKISSSFIPDKDCQLNKLNLIPENSGINLYDLVNFRNRHFTPKTWPQLLLGGEGCETTTYSIDWQFAPHPSMFVFRKTDTNLFFGALSLPQSFGMYIKAADYWVKHCYLDYGQEGYGLKIKKGEKFSAPDFCVFLDHNKSVYDTLDKYINILVSEKYIPKPSDKKTYPWHIGSLYCTWIDQVYLSNVKIPAELNLQQSASKSAIEVMDETLVKRAVQVIKEENLPFKTVLLDDGWQTTRGQWEPHPKRFPDMRKLVDYIHSLGMKVVVWWNWAELYDDAQVNPQHLIENGKRNRHGKRMMDYSKPQTQKKYLKPLFYKLFSSDKDCYDLDGVKTDFLADKVHADMPVYNQQWRGEENYFFNIFQLFYTIMRRIKKDACHIGCAGHPYLSQFIDINRTYDVHNSDYREHVNRALMLKHTTSQTPVAYDFHTFLEHLEEYLKCAKDNGCSIQIGNILGVQPDRFSEWEPAGKEYYKILKKYL